MSQVSTGIRSEPEESRVHWKEPGLRDFVLGIAASPPEEWQGIGLAATSPVSEFGPAIPPPVPSHPLPDSSYL